MLTGIRVFRLVRVKDDKPHTLFHGINRSTTIPLNRWVEAERKMVRDGGNTTPYVSGFHVLMSRQACEDYLTKFKNTKDLVIVECEAVELRQKLHSRSPVYLAGAMRISEQNWQTALSEAALWVG